METTYYTFKLSTAEADQIVQALGEQKYRISAKLIANMQMQFQQQQQNAKTENVESGEVETEKVA